MHPASIGRRNHLDISGDPDGQFVAQRSPIHDGQRLQVRASSGAERYSELSRFFIDHCVGFLCSDAFLTGDRGRRYGRRAARGLSSGAFRPRSPAALSGASAPPGSSSGAKTGGIRGRAGTLDDPASSARG
jgi:hypothetical protein